MSTVVPPSYSVLVVESECRPIIRTGIDFLDRALVCIGGYGITPTIFVIVFFVSLLLFRR